ncbi:MAG: xanthine dehydrogenase family protein molybdopterin-binding subunit [Solirubrobacterales bacterium]|nr:xanthine dehydrogenase family protein molybdopterin-binding subunit [Solirubrobacterales bacterium]MBV9681400.1 xanthine dehydrogenase family protein molybdopterin-binding subunit [Solirubrobacterales bacterium]MBV9808010.1 xanthine dehydrogenase family protein molybdopterin-binding subunit [Solirubrobacterales bacterium]
MIGRPLRRREDLPLVQGHGRYVDDLNPSGLAHVAFVRSHHARARIVGVRVPAVAPGLLRVLTAADLVGRARPLPVMEPQGAAVADVPHPILAEDEVRYAGQPVAAVVAESRAQAVDATELVEVEYEQYSAVVEPSGAPETLLRWERTAGDVDGMLAAAAHRVKARHRIPRLVAAPIEPRGVVVAYDDQEDLLTVWASAQDPHRPLAQLAHALERPAEKIRVLVPDVGGAFGSKGVIALEAVAVAIAAIELGRPLKWIEDRAENFLAAYQGRGVEAEVELGLDGRGRILAVRARILADLGAYLLPSTAIPPHTTAMLMTGCYDVPAAAVSVRGARTDKVPTGPYRGAGRPEAAYLLERTVDVAARQLGIDPVCLRRRNLIRSFPYRSALGWTYDSGDYERCLDRALELVGAPPPGRLVGTGVAMYVERAGGNWESARVTVEATGRVIARSGSSPHGQGHATTFAQIVADGLGISAEDVEVRFGDLPGVGTFASRSVAMGGSALVRATERLLNQAARRAAGMLGCRPHALTRSGLRWTAPDGRAVTLAQIAGAAGDLQAEARFESDLVFGSGAYAAVVEIDPATGALHVLRLAAVDDAGTIINPLLAEGQVVGGVVQGLGAALMEEVVYDADGQLRNASFAEYSLLGTVEQPTMATAFVQTPSPNNPLGAKGIGEGGAIGTPAAIANAVADALGGPAPDPPFTAEKLWRALRGQTG